MSNITLTPNMNLPVPVVGQEPGPDYASDVNSSLTLIDSHDHTPGSGVLITPLAININSALSFNNNLLNNVAGVNFEAQTNTPAVGTIYERGLDLYYVDGLGNDVRITQDGGVAGTPGSISGLVPPASASYIPGNSSFVWQSNTNIAANMDMGSVLLRNLSPNSTFALTLAPPPGLSSNFQITLPTLPAVQSFMTINASGLIQAPAAFNQGLVNSNLANETITAAKIAPQTIDGSRMVNHTVTFLQLDQAIFENQEIDYSVVAATYAVRAATTTNGSLSTAFHNGSVIDGVTLVTGNIILLKNQTLASENGVYVVQVAGSPIRDVNYDTVAELNFAGVVVTSGTVNAGKSYYQNAYLVNLTDAQAWSESQSYKFVVPSTGVKSIEYEMCGGGGGGGGGSCSGGLGSPSGGGAGGGGGGVKVNGVMTVAANDILSITVGAGGLGGAGAASNSVAASNGVNGSPSLIINVTSGNTVAAAGGGGGGGGMPSNQTHIYQVGQNGGGAIGSGGAAGLSNAPVNNGGAGSGGGGSYGPGGNGGSTDIPIASNLSSILGYGGGGGGGGAGQSGLAAQAGAAGANNNFGFASGIAYAGGTGGVTGGGSCGGAGGGGAGPYGAGANAPSVSNPGAVGVNAAAGTGAGGSAASASITGSTGKVGGQGGSGRVIIRYYGS